jgi:Cdc6-like AAA superfamily ATPase
MARSSLHRDTEKEEIFNYIKNSINTFVCGPQGTGKTTLIKKIAEDVGGTIGQAIYVDCSLYQTANAILREVLISLGSVIASKSNYDLTKRLKEKTKKLKVYVFLDHFECLKRHDILSILSGLNFCVCLIADSLESRRFMGSDNRTKFTNIVSIERLTDEQIFELVREESCANTTDEIIKEIIEKSEGNLTLALNMLRSFEANPKRMEILDRVDTCDLNEEHSVILALLREHNRLPSGELYGLYCQKSEFHKSDRSFRNFMQSLCKQGIVKSIGDKRGRSYQIVEAEVSNG